MSDLGSAIRDAFDGDETAASWGEQADALALRAERAERQLDAASKANQSLQRERDELREALGWLREGDVPAEVRAFARAALSPKPGGDER
jgi:hypothetical protein